MSVAPQNHPAPEAPAGPVPSAGGTRVGETLILLTHDESLIEALVNVVPKDALTVVADESALAHHLLSGYTGVVLHRCRGPSAPRPGTWPRKLAQRLHHQLPDVVRWSPPPVMARHKASSLAQVTDGTIYRFVHKTAVGPTGKTVHRCRVAQTRCARPAAPIPSCRYRQQPPAHADDTASALVSDGGGRGSHRRGGRPVPTAYACADWRRNFIAGCRTRRRAAGDARGGRAAAGRGSPPQ